MKTKILLTMIITAGLAAWALAAPLAPPLSTTNPTAGETAILAAFSQTTAAGYVDWMVLPGGSYAGTDFAPLITDVFGSTDIPTGQFLYAYQVESVMNNGNSFTVGLTDASQVLSAGSSDLDLDLVGHDAANFPNLGPPPPTEQEFADQLPLVGVAGAPVISSTGITWQFNDNLTAGQESVAIWFTSNSIPSYQPADLTATVPGPAGPVGPTPTPTPIPAPGAVLLGMIGLAVIGWAKRRFA